MLYMQKSVARHIDFSSKYHGLFMNKLHIS